MVNATQDPSETKGLYLLAVDKIPLAADTFQAYFVGSTAPNNVEDGIDAVENPEENIKAIATFLCEQDKPELLITVHGYNSALGEFATADLASEPSGVRGWYQEIGNHIAQYCDRRSPGLILIGYRWPSEQIKGSGKDSLANKARYAQESLPIFLRVILGLSFAILGSLVIAAFTHKSPDSAGFSVFGVIILVLATIFVSIVLTFFLLRIIGYLRDSYRASNYGVPDLVELIRQLDKAVLETASHKDPHKDWSQHRIKLSFIGHSMGGFVVTDTVRILSNVFDHRSIGSLGAADKAKTPSSEIGNVFSLGRLVLVAPDIPAETIISGRANFLSSSLRRFQETYLFSNEGDMALRLASTVANYASFPAKTREGGYRLGNVAVRSPQNKRAKQAKRYGIVNLIENPAEDCELADVQNRVQGGFEPKQNICTRKDGGEGFISSFLDYLYILRSKSLSKRQQEILSPDQKPIAELFTVFDCTDYAERLPITRGQAARKVGLLTYALGKRSLSFWNYIRLAFAMFTGEIDSHGGYFYTAPDPADNRPQPKPLRPSAQVSKQLIYGLACLGFQSFITSLSTENAPHADESAIANKHALNGLSRLCANRQIQVLLAAERYNRDILGIKTDLDRSGY